MKNLRNVLAGLAVVFAISGAYATSMLVLVPGYERIGFDFDANDPTECEFKKMCDTVDRQLGFCKFSGIQIFGENPNTNKCELVVYEPL